MSRYAPSCRDRRRLLATAGLCWHRAGLVTAALATCAVQAVRLPQTGLATRVSPIIGTSGSVGVCDVSWSAGLP